MDRQPRRPGLRLELRAAGAGRGLRQRRRQGEVRARLRRRVGQGDEPRPVRPRLSCSAFRGVQACLGPSVSRESPMLRGDRGGFLRGSCVRIAGVGDRNRLGVDVLRHRHRFVGSGGVHLPAVGETVCRPGEDHQAHAGPPGRGRPGPREGLAVVRRYVGVRGGARGCREGPDDRASGGRVTCRRRRSRTPPWR